MKKTLSLVLALCLVFTACAALAEQGVDWTTTGVETTGTNYLCDEKTTLTVCTYDGVSQAFDPIGNYQRFWQWMEDYTNVHIEWEVHSNADFGTVRTTKIAAGEIDTDIMNIGSISTAVQAGFSGLAAPIELDWIPNIIEYNNTVLPIILTNTTASDGNIYCICGNVSPDLGHICYMYNAEWLEKLGREVPTTLDEFYDLCVAMKEAGDLNGNGEADEIILTGSGMSMTNILGNSFGLVQYEDCDAFYPDENGVVQCELVSDKMRDLWAYCAQLFSEGILDPGIASTSADDMSQKIASDKVGIFIYYSAFSVTYGKLTSRGQADPSYQTCVYAMGEALTGPNGDKFYSLRNRAGNDACIISANSKNVELAARWLDVLTCDPKAMKVRTCGWEGEQYYYDENGDMQLIYPEDGSTWNISRFGCGQIAMPHYQNYDQLMNSKLNMPWYVEQYDKILHNNDWIAPGVPIIGAYTDEEQELIDMSKSDCNSYFKEARAKFITGEMDINTQWDEYVKTMYGLGLQSWIDAEQMIYDRTR